MWRTKLFAFLALSAHKYQIGIINRCRDFFDHFSSFEFTCVHNGFFTLSQYSHRFGAECLPQNSFWNNSITRFSHLLWLCNFLWVFYSQNIQVCRVCIRFHFSYVMKQLFNIEINQIIYIAVWSLLTSEIL